MGQVQGKTQSLLDGAPVSMKRCISFIQIQIYQCRIVKEKKEKVKFLHKLNSSFPPPSNDIASNPQKTVKIT